MQHEPRHDLSTIKIRDMLSAIREFNRVGRTAFLDIYNLHRSSKYYLMHDQRIYDTKVLVAAAYEHATERPANKYRFSGGAQTIAVFRRLKEQGSTFALSQWFEDRLGELRNLSGEFDRLPKAGSPLQALGFSDWILLTDYGNLNTRDLPGVYVIATARQQPGKMNIVDKRVVYIGESVDQSLYKRLYQLDRSLLQCKRGHGGGIRLREMGLNNRTFWLSVRSFPLGYGLDDVEADFLRAAQIRLLERTLLYEYVLHNRRYPVGNVK